MLAAVSLVAAAVGALGPADALRTTYIWPPRAMPERTPQRLWYTSLLLVRQEPETTAPDPVLDPTRLQRSREPTTVVATARTPKTPGDLAVTRADDLLAVSVGGQVWRGYAPPRVRPTGHARFGAARRGRWAIEGGSEAVRLGGSLERMPVVFGLFSGSRPALS